MQRSPLAVAALALVVFAAPIRAADDFGGSGSGIQ